MKPTMQQLREMSEKDFIAAVLHEKLDKMQNPNTPLAAKVRAAINYIANQPNQTKRGGTWALTITDTDGSSITPINLPDAELAASQNSCGKATPAENAAQRRYSEMITVNDFFCGAGGWE